jgi:hypothetical protein
MGATLSECLLVQFLWGHGDWRWRARFLNLVRYLRHWLRPRRGHERDAALPKGHILLTWYSSTPRLDDMLLPVLAELADEPCAVVYRHADIESRIPSSVSSIAWGQAVTYGVEAWRQEYRRCRPEWKRRLADIGRRFDLPNGALELLSLNLMLASQRVAGSLEFLERSRPSVVLTEFDRNPLWSCLVLAARRLRIPSVTLVHGVMEQDAIGFSPVLADLIVCWGDLDRGKLINAGEPAEKIIVGGCPRLSRDLSVTRAQGKARLALDPIKPAVMFATSPGRHALELAQLFCAGIECAGAVSGVIRLHPAEESITYAQVAQRHPQVRFLENEEASLDESLAAADVVVVCESGLGSDALVKRRPVIVLNPAATLTGHDWDLVELAGCPHARAPEELADSLAHMLRDPGFREQRAIAAERYVADFCAAYGQDSARGIADIVRRVAGTAGPRSECFSTR